MKKTEEIRIRDPFVLHHGDYYYLYGTIGEPKARELYVHRSTDLLNWEEPTVIYEMPENSWAEGQLWAPEVHYYRGRFYLFHSMLGKDGLRGTEISVSDTPEGPFIPISDRPATPAGKSCIDGTLYVEDGRPYIVYSHDWPDCYSEEMGAYVGEFGAVELSEDLTHAVGEPFLLFRSCDAPLSGNHPTPLRYQGKDSFRFGSDAPFLYRLRDGRLCFLWSPIPEGNYVVLAAIGNSIRGTWQHLDTPVFSDNGGHPMIFTDKDGRLRMALHHPEIYWHEHPRFLVLEERDGRLVHTEG